MSATPRVDSSPSYLTKALLLRGRLRVLVTAVLVASYLLVGPYVLDSLGYTTNVVVGPVVLLVAWMWGRAIGVAAAVAGVTINSYWAYLADAGWAATGPRMVEAGVITAVAFLLGHVGQLLERALGARARSDLAYTELERVARDRMLTITDQVPVGLYRTTLDGRIVGGNEALMRILGLADREEMLQANVWDYYVRSEDREDQIHRPSSDDGSWREFELRRADGVAIWVRDWARAVTDDAGRVVHFDGVLEDITEQRLTAARFQAAFEDSPIGMTIAGFDGRIVRWNAAVSDLLGRSPEEIEGIHFSEYSFDEDAELTRSAFRRLKAGESVRYEKRFIRSDGSVVWVLVSLAPISEGNDPPRHFISHVVDITDRRRAQEALENLVRSKDELIASVSHELRTPLTVVHGLAQELDSDWMSFSVVEQKEFIGLIAQQSAEVAHIVEDLLVAARADIGKLPIQAETVDVLEQVELAIGAVPDLEVSVSKAGGTSPVMHADASRVRQILRNLLSNALRYGGDEVSICCGVNGRYCWIDVIDNGDGIGGEDVAKVFQPYERAHNAAGQPLSVGLGLTVSRKLAELMGGGLSYRYEEGNSVFRLTLPSAGSVRVATAGYAES